jgi:hypothetical protein
MKQHLSRQMVQALDLPPEKQPWRPSNNYPLIVRQFVEEECIQHPEAEVKSNDLYSLYVTWENRRGKWPMNNIVFGQALGALGYGRFGSNGQKWRTGLYPKDWPKPPYRIRRARR